MAEEKALSVRDDRWSRDEIELIKRTIAVGATDDELKLFLMTAARLGLDPFSKQIHCVKRKRKNPDTGEWEEVAVIQVGIDGFRAVADRTEAYAPGPEPTFVHDDKGNLISATAYVKKRVGDEWHVVGATAYFAEYCQRNRDGQPRGLWATMPHAMLAKCAEGLALRRAFPMQLAGVYAPEEMDQAENVITVQASPVETAHAQDKPAAKVSSNGDEWPQKTWTKWWLWLKEQGQFPSVQEATDYGHNVLGVKSMKEIPASDREAAFKLILEKRLAEVKAKGQVA